MNRGDKAFTAFKELFDSVFTEPKLKSDFILYLTQNYNSLGSSFTVSVRDAETGVLSNATIVENDPITIISYLFITQAEGETTFLVTIGVGKFKENYRVLSFFEVEKCLAHLKYNRKFEIVNVDFSMSTMNQMRKCRL